MTKRFFELSCLIEEIQFVHVKLLTGGPEGPGGPIGPYKKGIKVNLLCYSKYVFLEIAIDRLFLLTNEAFFTSGIFNITMNLQVRQVDHLCRGILENLEDQLVQLLPTQGKTEKKYTTTLFYCASAAYKM